MIRRWRANKHPQIEMSTDWRYSGDIDCTNKSVKWFIVSFFRCCCHFEHINWKSWTATQHLNSILPKQLFKNPVHFLLIFHWISNLCARKRALRLNFIYFRFNCSLFGKFDFAVFYKYDMWYVFHSRTIQLKLKEIHGSITIPTFCCRQLELK